MFEDNTNYDFSDDLLQSSFTSVSSHQRDLTIKTDQISNEPIKRHISDSDCKRSPKRNKNISIINVPKNNDRSPIKAVPRKFPGPAGLLPDSCDTNSMRNLFHNKTPESGNSPDFFLCSQKNLSVFENGPWQQMMVDFQDSKRDLLFELFNIFWIKEKFSGKKQPPSNKAPFLACAIESIELTEGKTVKIILKDKTGIIQGTIMDSLYDEYSKYFTMGSVLVLIQFGVLSAQNSHCLTITPNNLIAIYYVEAKSGKDERNTLSNCEVKKIVLQQYSIDTIWERYGSSLNCQDKKPINLSSIRPSSSNTPKILPNMKNILNTNSSNVNKPLCTKLDLTSITTSSTFDSEHIFNNSHSSQITCDKANSEIWKDFFQEVDPGVFLDDF